MRPSKAPSSWSAWASRSAGSSYSHSRDSHLHTRDDAVYYRNADGDIIFRELKAADFTDPSMRPEGRFYNFFDRAKAASA